MKFQVTSVYKRPNPNVQWHGNFVLDAGLEEQKTVFLITNYYGKHEIFNEAPDELTLVVRSLWESEEEYNRFRNEPCIASYFGLVDQYFQSVGITAEPKVKQMVEGSFE